MLHDAPVHESLHVPPVHPVSRDAYVARPKFTSPPKAWMVFVIAHFASFRRVGSNPHEFFVALSGQEVPPGYSYCAFVGFVQLIMLPDVSMASMKYGFADAGHFVGSMLRQS